MWHVRVLQLLRGATTGQAGSNICLTNSLQKVCRDTLRAAASRRLTVARLLQSTPYLPPLVLPMIGSLQCAFQAGLGISMHAHIMCSAVQCCALQCNRAPHRGSTSKLDLLSEGLTHSRGLQHRSPCNCMPKAATTSRVICRRGVPSALHQPSSDWHHCQVPYYGLLGPPCHMYGAMCSAGALKNTGMHYAYSDTQRVLSGLIEQM